MIIAQISDPHISDVHANSAATHLQRAVDHVMRLPVLPNVMLVTGDCANNGSVAEYEQFHMLLQPLTMPVYVVPGNHDDRVRMIQIFGAQGTQPLDGVVQYVVDDWPVRLIALDTHVPGRGGGDLCATRLAWLEARLAEAPDRPIVLFMHHPPFRTGLAVLDQIGLHNAAAFGAIVARSPQVERIVAGHVHMVMVQRFGGTIAMTCAATDHQLLPDIAQPERLVVRQESPACLLHGWNATTGVITQTSVIGDGGPMIELHDGTQWVA